MQISFGSEINFTPLKMTKSYYKSNTSKSTTKSFPKSLESLAKSAKYLARQSERLNAQVKAVALQVFRGDGTSDDDDETDDYDARFLFSDDD